MSDMADNSLPADTRVSVSLGQLRAELTSLELRLVDRLNAALSAKADRDVVVAMTSSIAKTDARLTILEQRAVTQDSPVVAEIEELRQANLSLAEVGKYKRWLWAQTVALAGISIGILAFFVDHFSTGAGVA